MSAWMSEKPMTRSGSSLAISSTFALVKAETFGFSVEDLCDAGAPFGLKPEAIIPAYGMAETTVAVSFSECGGGMVVDEVDESRPALESALATDFLGGSTRISLKLAAAIGRFIRRS